MKISEHGKSIKNSLIIIYHEKIDLLPEQITQILSSDDILNLYPELACVRM